MPFVSELELEEELEEEHPFSLWLREAELEHPEWPSWPFPARDYTRGLFAGPPGSAQPSPGGAPRPPQTQSRPMPWPTQNHVANPFDIPFRWIAHVAIMKTGQKQPDSHGSGVLISDVHVLTAAHVVSDVLKDPARFSVLVTIALDGEKSLATRTLSKRPDVPYEFLKGDEAYDYAILTLSSGIADLKPRELKGAKLCYWGSSQCGGGTTAVPVEPGPPGAVAGPIIVRPPNLSGETAFTAGYPRNRGRIYMWAFSGMLAGASPQRPVMSYLGSLTEGQSGSPVWIQQDGTINLVGVAVSRGRVNRIIRLSWDMVYRLSEWMLKAEKSPELEFKGDQSKGRTSVFEARAQRRGAPVRFAESVYEVLPQVSEEFEEHELPPKGLAVLDHIHIPKKPDAAHPGTFTAGTLTKLTRDDLNPLFYTPAGLLILDSSPTGLQNCLDRWIASGFGGLLGSATQTAPGARDIVHVALVDLTGQKLTAPEFAGWGASVDMYGASVPKILALYATFQLRCDLRDLANRTSPSDGKQLEAKAIAQWSAKGFKAGLPDLAWLFDIRKWSPSATLDFTTAAKSAIGHIDDNCQSGTLIAKVSMPYIGSLAWQSGLYHPMRSGLWLRSSYCNMGSWASPVKTPWVHNATALSAAAYFTLLAQGRLVDNASSAAIKTALRSGCTTSLFPALPVVASKCGIYGGWIHDCAWIQDSSVRYVVAVLSKLSTATHRSLYTQLCAQLDALVRQNNQSPKAPCI
jgi:V8-like Glu-specific endopeptidase